MSNSAGQISNIPNVDTNFTGELHFEPIDYIVLVVLVLVSLGIGIYFGYFDGKERTIEEYLLGGRNMKTIPIAISLIASQLSAIAIIAIPAEMYSFGSHYMIMAVPSVILTILLLNYIAVPVFYSNNLDNCYTYLEIRFSRSVRNLVTFAFFVTISLFLPSVSYIGALAVSTVTGINTHVVNVFVFVVCITYTILGGIKAVVWTDVIQAFVMALSTVIIFVIGVVRIGGIKEVYQRNVGHRILPLNMTLDLETRQTVWNLLMGLCCTWTTYFGLNQVCVQRIVSLPTVKQARRAICWFGAGVVLIIWSNSAIGNLMYAQYVDCDPVKSMKVSKADQMVSYFVYDIVGHIPGLLGIFVACVLSATLSTVAANLNTIAGIIYKDYLSKLQKFQNSEVNARYTMYIIILMVSIYSVLMGLVVETYSSMYHMLYVVMGLSHGCILGVFMLGMLYPKANCKAALWATITSMVIVSGLTIGTQIEMAKGWSYKPLPTSIDGCNASNITEYIPNSSNATATNNSFSIFKISFQWNVFFGTIIVWIVGIPLSYIIGHQDMENFNVNLISPVARFLLPARIRRIELKTCTEKKKIMGHTENEEKTYRTENEVTAAAEGNNQNN